MSNPYPGGQCTWGAAQMFPCLQNLGQYGNFGNGGDWYSHAQSIGLPTSPTPVAGWLASFRTEGWPNGTGDVGLIVSVNNDGTVTRYGTNWHMDGQWSTDKVQQSIVIGSFQPPCTGTSLPAAAAQLMSASSSGNGQCTTFQWSIGPVSLCFDTLIGMASIGGGMLLMAAGLIVIIFGATGSGLRIEQSSASASAPAPAQRPVPPTFNPESTRAQAIERAAARRRAVPVQPASRRTSITAESVAAKMRAGKSLTPAETAYGNANQEAVGRALASMAPA